MVPAGPKLDSWKAIAAYLGRDVRTVQRWEKFEDLPVRRLGHLKRGSVYAFPAELDRWLAARSLAPPVTPFPPALEGGEPAASPQQPQSAPGPLPAPHSPLPTFPLSRALTAAALLAAVSLAIVFWLTRPRPRPLPPPVPNLQGLFAAATSEGGRLRLVAAGADPGALVLASQGRELYVASESTHSITILDTAALRPLATLQLANGPRALAATPDGSRVIAASITPDGLDLITTRTRQITWIALAAGVVDMALTPDGHTLYLAQGFDGLSRLDLTSFSLTHIATSACPSALALAPDGRTLYVGYQCGGPAGRRGYDTIGVFNTATQRFTATLAGNVPMVATALAVTPDGNELWSGSGDACSASYDHRGCPPGVATLIYIFSTSSGKLLTRIPVPSGAVTHIRFLAAGARALLDGRLADTTRREVLEALPDRAQGAAVLADGQRVFLSLPAPHGVAVFDPRPAAAACTPPTTDLAAWWPGDGTAADAWGLSAGRPSPGLRYAPAHIGQGFLFDGRSSLNFGHGAALAQHLQRGLTLALWLKPLAPGPGTLLAQQSPDGRHGWRLGLDPRLHLQLCLADAPCRSAPAPLRLAQWYFVAFRAHARSATLYLDSQLALRATIPTAANAAGADLVAGNGFSGILDELTYYSSPLGPAALQRLRALPACLH